MNARTGQTAVNQGADAAATGSLEDTRGRQKTRVGIVVSDKMEKTVVVAVMRQVMHPKYGKFVRRTSKFYAHDEAKSCGVGDEVKIIETRPMSRLKRWKIVEIVKKAD